MKTKLADQYYQFTEEIDLRGLSASTIVDLIDGEELDTRVEIKIPAFHVAGKTRHEFFAKLEGLISEYRI